MPGLNLPDLSVGFIDMAAVMSGPLPPVQPMPRGPAPVEVPDLVVDPNTVYAVVAKRLVELRRGDENVAELAKRLAALPAVAPKAAMLTDRREYDHSTEREVVADAPRYSLSNIGSFFFSYVAFHRSPGNVMYWHDWAYHLRYGHEVTAVMREHPTLPTKQWEVREIVRCSDGTYFALPWAEDLAPIPRHYAHISTVDPTMVSYTPDDAKGVADRQVRMKPGRYLAKYYPDMDADDVRKYAAMLDASFTELHLATTADEIEHVYTHGPSSCMSYPASSFDSPFHPARVYAAGDLAVAYTKKPDGKISGRCLVWPEKKLRGRIYGDIDRMKLLLKSNGYAPHEDSLDGARLVKHEVGNGSGVYVMPYIDNSNSFGHSSCRKFLVIGGCSAAAYTHGLSQNGTYCPRMDDYVDDDSEDFVYIEDRDERWSPTAVDLYAQVCDRTGDVYSDDAEFHDVIVPHYHWNTGRMVGRNRESWCASAVERHAWLCDATENYLSDAIAGVEVVDIGTVDPKWAEENCTACAVSGDLYETDQLVPNKDGDLVHPDHLADTEADASA